MSDAKIADLARRWFAAERERKMRHYEKRIALLLAMRSGAELSETMTSLCEPTGLRQLVGGDVNAVIRAEDARERYRKAAARAGALRSALSRLCPSKPEPDAEIEEAYADLCSEETAAQETAYPEFRE